MAEVMLVVTEVVQVEMAATLVEVTVTETLALTVVVEMDVVILSFEGRAGAWKQQKGSLTWSEV